MKTSYWKPKKQGETVQGTFQKFTAGKVKKQLTLAMMISNGKETIGVSITSALKSAIQSKLPDFKIGKTKVKFVYQGTQKGKNYKTPFKVIDFYFDGKMIETGKSPATQDEISDFFGLKS